MPKAVLNNAPYKTLLPIVQPEKRVWYEELTRKERLNRDQLAAAIRKNRYEKEHGPYPKRHPERIQRPSEPTFVYKATVERVIDGDTLFCFWTWDFKSSSVNGSGAGQN